MVEKSRRDRVGLGLIGLGPSWEQVYREPLNRLQNRLKIRLVHDPVEARARSVAGELSADVAGGLQQICTRHTLQGLLILDPGWCGAGLLNLVTRCGKPAYLGTPFLCDVSSSMSKTSSKIRQSPANEQISNPNDQLIPELKLRFTPASCRLRELIATRLGPVKQIEILCDLTADINAIAAIVDWCSDIMGSRPEVFANVAVGTTRVSPVELVFPPHQLSGSPISKRTTLLKQQSDSEAIMRIDVECQRGHATLTDRTHIDWQTSSESANESLTDERTEIEILIDQFCRRALGGLNPVGRLSEYARALDIARSIQRGRSEPR